MEVKTCTICGEDKPFAEFRFGGRASNGKRYRASDCNECHRRSSRSYRAAHLEERRAAELVYSRTHAERKRENARRWYADNTERAIENEKRRYRLDPEYKRDLAHMGRAKKHGAPVIEFVRRRKVFERDGGICHVCSEAVAWEDFQVDHVVPLSKGGDHTYANVKTTHRRCNLARRYSKTGDT
jgi:hypothetical protein